MRCSLPRVRYQDLPGTWQAQTSLSERPLAGDKSLTRNLDADALSTLSVTNTGNLPLVASGCEWLSTNRTDACQQRSAY